LIVSGSATRIIADAWRLTPRAIVAMPLLFGSALLALMAGDLAGQHLAKRLSAPMPMPMFLISLPMLLATNVLRQAFVSVVAASVLIAVHRFVILHEVIDRPVWRVPPAFWRFAGWMLLLTLFPHAWAFIELVTVLIAPRLGAAMPWFMSGALHLAAWVLVILVTLRLMLLFPALALGTPSAGWRSAWSDSRGHAWKFLAIQIVACLPIEVVAIGIFFVKLPSLTSIDAWSVLSEAFNLLLFATAAAAASRLFQVHAAALREPNDGAIVH
jgi:hypothetical protein